MAKVNHVRLLCPEVRGLIDPFTGKELEVFAHVCEGIVTYSAPGAFSLRAPQRTVDALMRRASTRGNVAGIADTNERMKCPYTGEALRVVETQEGLYRLDGGFDPTIACLSLTEFIEKASRGERKAEAPQARQSVEVPDLTPDDGDLAHKVVEEETEKAAHEMVKVIPGADKGRNATGWTPPAKAGKGGRKGK